MLKLTKSLAFQWDSGNKLKNWHKHRVSSSEAEEVFFDSSKRIAVDAFHSSKEDRYILLGKTKKKRQLYIVFTIRNENIRIISARDLSRKERRLYFKESK